MEPLQIHNVKGSRIVSKVHSSNEHGSFITSFGRILEYPSYIRIPVFGFSSLSDIKSSFSFFIDILCCQTEKGTNLRNQIILSPYKYLHDPKGTNFGGFLDFSLKIPVQRCQMKSVLLSIENCDTKTIFNFKEDKIVFKLVEDHQIPILSLVYNPHNGTVVFSFIKSQIGLIPKIFFKTFEESLIPYLLDDIKLNEKIYEVEVRGFDKSGEPIIEVYKEGPIAISFNFMPPLNGKDYPSELEIFNHFDVALAKISKCQVIHDDREHFIIPFPKKSTLSEVKTFLSFFWHRADIQNGIDAFEKQTSSANSDFRFFLKLILRILRFLKF